MEIHEYLEHTDAIVPKSEVKGGLCVLAGGTGSNLISSNLKTIRDQAALTVGPYQSLLHGCK